MVLEEEVVEVVLVVALEEFKLPVEFVSFEEGEVVSFDAFEGREVVVVVDWRVDEVVAGIAVGGEGVGEGRRQENERNAWVRVAPGGREGGARVKSGELESLPGESASTEFIWTLAVTDCSAEPRIKKPVACVSPARKPGEKE